MNVNPFLTKDYEKRCVFGHRKNKANQSGFDESPDDGLSFLPRIRVRDKLQQESRVLDRPGFRIKCGMTGLKARLTEYNLKKESQFDGLVIDAMQIITMVYGDFSG